MCIYSPVFKPNARTELQAQYEMFERSTICILGYYWEQYRMSVMKPTREFNII